MKRPVLGLAVVLVACGSGSTATPPVAPMDAGATDAARDFAGDAVADAVPTDAGGDASDPCGPLTTSWARCAANPLDVAGYEHPDGEYELSIGDPDVQYDPWDQTWRAWWSTGLSPTYANPDPDIAIKYASSADGVQWNVQVAPTYFSHRASGDWDYSTAETPSAIYVPTNPPARRWLLYYSGGNKTVKTGPGNTVWYEIGLAFSADGTNFMPLPAAESPYAGKSTPYANIDGLLLLARDAFPGLAGVVDGQVADPEIVRDDAGTFHLFFSSYAVDANGGPLAFGVSHATSTDGIHFTPQMGNPILPGSGGAGPSVRRAQDGTWELFFYRDSKADLAMVPSTFNPMLGIWRATSTDLATWSVPSATRELTWDGSYPYEAYGWVATGDMAFGAPELRWYYVAFSSQNPPAGWFTTTHTGTAPAVIALSMAQRTE
jgi:hypothetical protein